MMLRTEYIQRAYPTHNTTTKQALPIIPQHEGLLVDLILDMGCMDGQMWLDKTYYRL